MKPLAEKRHDILSTYDFKKPYRVSDMAANLLNMVALSDTNIGSKFPIATSAKQRQLEAQGCIFRGQELLDNHELDPLKDCYCGRPTDKKEKKKGRDDE
jgi:hypothetical protein